MGIEATWTNLTGSYGSSNWTDYDTGTNRPQYYVDGFRVMRFRGLVKSTGGNMTQWNVNPGLAISASLLPVNDMYVSCQCATGGVTAMAHVYVRALTPAPGVGIYLLSVVDGAGYLSLAGIQYRLGS